MRIPARHLLELAGISSGDDIGWSHQLPKRVRLDGVAVEYDLLYGEGSFGPGEPVADFGFPDIPQTPVEVSGRLTLVTFLNLAGPTTPPARFASFVRRFGPLPLCAHGLPRTHRSLPTERYARDGVLCMEVEDGGTHGKEPVELLRFWAQLARATVACALSLDPDADVPDLAAEWQIIFKEPPPADVQRRAAAVSRILTSFWAPLGMVGVAIDLNASPRVHTTTFPGAIGPITLGLIETALRGGIAFCSSCLQAVVADRAPQRGRDFYCGELSCTREKWRRARTRKTRGAPLRRKPRATWVGGRRPSGIRDGVAPSEMQADP